MLMGLDYSVSRRQILLLLGAGLRIAPAQTTNRIPKMGNNLLDSSLYVWENSSWWSIPVVGGRMQRINDFEFYKLAVAVHPIMQLDGNQKIKDCWYDLFRAKVALEAFLTTEIIPLVIVKPSALVLFNALKVVVEKKRPDAAHPTLSDQTLDSADLYPLRTAVREFETVLSAELQSAATYFVSRKLAYETRVLMEEAERILPTSIVSELEDSVIEELRQAGRCIVFDAPTAAAFHIIRATEDVIRKYYAHVIGTIPQVKARNWGSYINKLQTVPNANHGVIAILDHVRETYRNPILHPEVTISEDQAQIILGICISAISQMVLVIKSTAPASPPIVPVRAITLATSNLP
jgi:hypothetical protein